jgi:hypothetical protein
MITDDYVDAIIKKQIEKHEREVLDKLKIDINSVLEKLKQAEVDSYV